MNFHRYEVYTFKNSNQELNKDSEPKKSESKTKYKKLFESFNLQNNNYPKTSSAVRIKGKQNFYTNRSASMQQNYPPKKTITPRGNFSSIGQNLKNFENYSSVFEKQNQLNSQSFIAPQSIKKRFKNISYATVTPTKLKETAKSMIITMEE